MNTSDRMSLDTVEVFESTSTNFVQKSLPTSCQRLMVPMDQIGRINAQTQVSRVWVISPNPSEIKEIPTSIDEKITANSILFITFILSKNYYITNIQKNSDNSKSNQEPFQSTTSFFYKDSGFF